MSEDDDWDVTEIVGRLIDMNQQITIASRKLARNVLVIRDAHLEAAEMCVMIARSLGESARVSAENTADIITNEWGLNLDDDDEEDEDDDS